MQEERTALPQVRTFSILPRSLLTLRTLSCRQPCSEASLFLLDAFEPTPQEVAKATQGVVLRDDERDVKPNKSMQEEYNSSGYSLSGIIPSTKVRRREIALENRELTAVFRSR